MKRNAGIDGLKIMAMVMVVVLHATSPHYGLKDLFVPYGSFEYVMIAVLRTFSSCAVNCFVLISGYYLSEKPPTFRKLRSLWTQVFAYSVTIYVMLCAIPESGVAFSVKQLVMNAIPLLTGHYWFFTVYFLLMLIAPMLKQWMDGMSEPVYRKNLGWLLAVFSVIPSINVFGDPFGTENGYSLIWFSILFLLAGYIRRFPIQLKRPGLAYVFGSLAVSGLYMTAEYFARYSSVFQACANLMHTYNHVFVLGNSVFLFTAAVQFSKRIPDWISGILGRSASLSLGVYLLHEHRNIREYLWQSLVRLQSWQDHSNAFFFRMLIAVIGIVLAGMVFEWIRRCIFAGCRMIIKRSGAFADSE